MTNEIKKLKLARLRQFEHMSSINSNNKHISFIKRNMIRYQQLSAVYPEYKVYIFFLKRLTYKLKSLLALRVFPFKIAMSNKYTHSWKKKVARDNLETFSYSILISGGLGDAIVIARLIRDLQIELDNSFAFDIYFHSPKNVIHFFKSIPGFREAINSELFDATKRYYCFSMRVNQFVTFEEEFIDYPTLIKHAPKVLNIIAHAIATRRPIEKYIAATPFLDGAFADLFAKKGYRRQTFLHSMLDLPYGGDHLDLLIDYNLITKLGLKIGSYITVHDGWDTKFPLLNARPVKSIPIDTWSKIVSEIKTKRPDLQIVQIGSNTGNDILGVDINLKNKLTFFEAVSVLSNSRLHLDTESGLVHVAASIGVRSVVMFGPTSVEWFSYPQNINLAPKKCGNCWWMTDTWMDVCVLGYEIPICTTDSSIMPTEVAMSAITALNEQDGFIDTDHMNKFLESVKSVPFA